MDGSKEIPDLGPLPKSDKNADLQEESIKALHALLRKQNVLSFRDERKDDWGVDGSLEIEIHGQKTNFRSQVQLKGTASASRNLDGTVSLSVSSANFNYLMDGTAPLYLLFDAATDGFWYVWARDELRRLEVENPGWKGQKSVTLHFSGQLRPDNLSVISEGILREGRKVRQLHDALARTATTGSFPIAIDKVSGKVTTSSDALDLLQKIGLAISAAGYPQEALRLFGLVEPSAKELPQTQLSASYAEYSLGKHANALGHARQAQARRSDLSERDRTFLDRLRDACEFRIGLISAETLQQRASTRAQALRGLESFEARMEAAYSRFWVERDLERREELASEIRNAADEIAREPSASKAAKLGARLSLMYVEGTCAALALTHHMGMFRIRQKFFAAQTREMASSAHDTSSRSFMLKWRNGQLKNLARGFGNYGDAAGRMSSWRNSSEKVLSEISELGHPIMTAEALRVALTFRLWELLEGRFEALWADQPFEIPDSVALSMLGDVTRAEDIDAVTGCVEGKLKSEIINADILEAIGRLSEAKNLAQKILPEAEAMGFEDIARRARELIEDRSIIMEFERDIRRFKNSDPDEWFGVSSDEELHRFAETCLEAMDLPTDRLSIMERYCASLREIARERWNWCRHLEMKEDLTQTQDPARAFTVMPNRRCVCENFGFETSIITSDSRALIDAFKRLYCVSCKERSAKRG